MSQGPDVTVLLLGSGGREHALAWKLARSPRLKNLFAAPGSDAIAAWAQNVALDPTDPAAVVSAAKDLHAKLVFIGPEAPLAAGVADALRAAGIPVFGPDRKGAQLNFKAYSRTSWATTRSPPPLETFTDPSARAVEAMRLPLVIRPTAWRPERRRHLQDTNQALDTVTEFMEHGAMGSAGKTLIVERYLEGPELSALALLDGKTCKLLPYARDHKRLKDHDEGPNTGGMGACAPVAVDGPLQSAIDSVMAKILAGLRADGIDYRGVLYVGFILTKDGPQVLEFNCRFGDPEAQAVLPLLKSDLITLALACAEGKLSETEVGSLPGACVCVTLASEGYPAAPLTGRAVSGLESVKDALVFHAGTKKTEAGWTTTGGRVLGVTALGADLTEARRKAYAAVKKIHFEGMQCRSDIGGVEALSK